MQPITRLLVANRGEIARRVFRTCREMGISTVAVYAEPDADAPFVSEADIAVALHGTTSAETYLDSARLITAARKAGANAIEDKSRSHDHNGAWFPDRLAWAQAPVEQKKAVARPTF